MHKLLHIMPHMGPGVGKAISALSITAAKIKSDYQHKVLLLEKPQNLKYITICKENNIDVFWPGDKKELISIIADADIVQLEWWHHPLVLGFLKDLSQIPIRLTVWSHISGCNYPVIPADFINIPERFFFTTAYSYGNPFWNEKEKQEIISKSTVACGSGGYDNVTGIVAKSHSGFNIGFIGTLDFRKLNPEFVDFCAEVNISNSRFILVGNPENKQSIIKQAQKKNIENKFEFTGFTNDVKAEFERFDVFGYLLNPDHYGATDNALLEAMGAGMPIIVLNQCGEKHVIKHMETGIIINNKKEYGQAVKYLYDNPEERERLGENAGKSAFNEFSPQSTMQKLHRQYENIISIPKKCYQFEEVFGIEPYQWFSSGLGKERRIFESFAGNHVINKTDLENQIHNSRDILKGSTKSSIPHFYNYFPFDINLKSWIQIINERDN